MKFNKCKTGGSTRLGMPVANIIFSHLKVYFSCKMETNRQSFKIIITAGRDCGSAPWIKIEWCFKFKLTCWAATDLVRSVTILPSNRSWAERQTNSWNLSSFPNREQRVSIRVMSLVYILKNKCYNNVACWLYIIPLNYQEIPVRFCEVLWGIDVF